MYFCNVTNLEFLHLDRTSGCKRINANNGQKTICCIQSRISHTAHPQLGGAHCHRAPKFSSVTTYPLKESFGPQYET